MKLKCLVLAAAACVFALSRANAAESVQVQIVRGGKEVQKTPKTDFVENVIRLTESCSVNSTAYAVTNTTWTNLLHSASFVRVSFKPARKLKMMMISGLSTRERAETEIDQILVPLAEDHWPEHIYGRVGYHVYSFTKYNPIAFKHVIVEPALALTSIKPYSEAVSLPEK